MEADKVEHHGAVADQAKRGVRGAIAVARWAGLIFAGCLVWMLGLVLLDVPAELEIWRHLVGAMLLLCAVFLWRRAVSASECFERTPDEK